MTETRCFSCGARVPDVEGPVHRYMLSSPGCWAVFGEVSAREYSNALYARNHRLTVDAYAVQHPGQPSPQSIQSVAVHLVSLYVIFERETEPRHATRLIQRMTAHRDAFIWLEPPGDRGPVTVRDVLEAKDARSHLAAVEAWARCAWEAWRAWHGQVREWARFVT